MRGEREGCIGKEMGVVWEGGEGRGADGDGTWFPLPELNYGPEDGVMMNR